MTIDKDYQKVVLADIAVKGEHQNGCSTFHRFQSIKEISELNFLKFNKWYNVRPVLQDLLNIVRMPTGNNLTQQKLKFLVNR